MNRKIAKLRAERDKNTGKIAVLQTRNKEIDEEVRSLENTDIIGIVREQGLTPEELAELLSALKQSPLPEITKAREESYDENED